MVLSHRRPKGTSVSRLSVLIFLNPFNPSHTESSCGVRSLSLFLVVEVVFGEQLMGVRIFWTLGGMRYLKLLQIGDHEVDISE